ncbi:MAG: hypothetical protein FJ356_06140 [Thaumarchaeota archaeon]|nr:hypothetical protein [Nitrososphaerota archaeon]
MAITYTPIATTTITSDTQATGVTFSNIPATYTDLKIIASVSGVNTGDLPLVVRLNEDSGNNYSKTEIGSRYESATGYVDSRRLSNQNRIDLTSYYNMPGSPIFATIEVDIFSYAGSKFKSLICRKFADNDGSGEHIHNVGLWNSTAAVTSVSLIEVSLGDRYVKTGSTYTLYGIKAE